MDHACKRFAGYSEYADRAAQSPASTGCVAHCCAARTGSAVADSCFATTRFASSCCLATRLLRRLGAARQCQCLTLLSHSPSLLSFREIRITQYGAWSVHGHAQYTGTTSVLLRSMLHWGAVETPASGISAGCSWVLSTAFTPILLRANIIYCGNRMGPCGEVAQVVRGSS